ncbi:MAG: hypothetical protein VKJ24_09260 [Synechococcales bacterium]|nr:hypothetical protein [Synechococcales bacterium]
MEKYDTTSRSMITSIPFLGDLTTIGLDVIRFEEQRAEDKNRAAIGVN